MHAFNPFTILSICSLLSGDILFEMESLAAPNVDFLVLIMLLLMKASSGAASDTMAVGESLTRNQTLLSSKGTFEFGFFNLKQTGKWCAGIWYAQIPDLTVVWVANGAKPLDNNNGALLLTEDGSLVLSSYGGSIMWSANGTRKASSAVMTDEGNLILYGADDKSDVVWQSFDSPGNTLLPGMKITKTSKLTAWKSAWDPRPGDYVLEMDPSGADQFVLRRWNSEIYWESGLWNPNRQTFGNIPEMTQNYFYSYSFFSNGTHRYFTYNMKQGVKILSRLVMSNVGEIYLLQAFNSGWWLFWTKPGMRNMSSVVQDLCKPYPVCPAYGSCDQTNVQLCQCVQGFGPKNNSAWQSGDGNSESSGCVRRSPLDCSAMNHTTDGFVQLTRISTLYKADLIGEHSSMGECETACHRNCSCTAYAFVTSGISSTCQMWFGDSLYFVNTPYESDSLHLRLAASDLPKTSLPKTSKRSYTGRVVGAVGGLAALVAVSLAFFVCGRHRRSACWKSTEHDPASVTVFSYRELQVATKNFSERLGGGGFGSVFKGITADNTHVAVKKLEGSSQGEKQFWAEVSTTGIIQHVNLIRLRGFCSEGSHRLLVYDYMPNCSLNTFLFPKPGKESNTLDWKTRFNIALGTARGLLYLHENCRDCIIHCDIKPENILLDSDFCPKVADFGLAKQMGREFSHVLTTMRGTRGYLAPEWIFGLPITAKADVYSFGMMLLEIIAGRRNMDTVPESSQRFFPAWAAIQINAGNTVALLDKRVDNNADAEQVRRAAMVSGWCIQDDEDARPSMKQVVQILEGNRDVAAPPVPSSLQDLVADPNSMMAYRDEEIQATALSVASQ